MDNARGLKYSADKIAFLGLFAAALLIARLVTVSRSVVGLSEPIRLNYTGLSVSMPSGNGWQSEKQWKYKESGFTLGSVFFPGSGSLTTLVRCRYLLAAAKVCPDIQFQQKASLVGGTVAETAQTFLDTLIIDWAHIRNQRILLEMFFGVVELPNGRQLDIEVRQAAGDADLAEQVFKLIAENLKFEDSQLLEAGSEIIADIKSKGINAFLDNQSREDFFLIKDAGERTIGFTMDVLVDSPNRQLNIQAASSYYIRGRYSQEEITFFQSNNSFGEFVCKNESKSPVGSSGTELILDESTGLTVRKFDAPAKEKVYQPGPAAISEVLLDLAFSQMLDTSHKKILIDIIEADGTITPALISRIDAGDELTDEQSAAVEEEAAYMLVLELLDGRGFSEYLYFNDQKQISKILLQQNGSYILERSSVEEILREFPERAGYILRKDEILEQNQS